MRVGITAGVDCAVLLKVPPPEKIVQAPVLAEPPTVAPVKVIATGGEDWQTVMVLPGVTVAARFTVISTVALTAGHGPGPSGSFVVKVRVTVLLGMPGVYVDVREFISEKLPLGADHEALVALPP